MKNVVKYCKHFFGVFEYSRNTGSTSGREGYIGSDWVFFMISPSVFDYTKGEFLSWKMINYVKKYVLYFKKVVYSNFSLKIPTQ